MSKSIYTKEQVVLVSKLIKARKDASLSQTEVAKKLGKTQSFVSKIESGQRRIDIVQLKELLKIYKKDIAHFL